MVEIMVGIVIKMVVIKTISTRSSNIPTIFNYCTNCYIYSDE